MKTQKQPGKILPIAAVIVAIGLFFIAAKLAFYQEPSYQGRPFSSWFKDLDRSVSGGTESATYSNAVFAIQQMGSNACGPLLEILRRDPDKPSGMWYYSFWNRISPWWRKFLPKAEFPNGRRLIALQLLHGLDQKTRSFITSDLIDLVEKYYSMENGYPSGRHVDWTQEYLNPPNRISQTHLASGMVRMSQIELVYVIQSSASKDPRIYPMLLTLAQETDRTQQNRGRYRWGQAWPSMSGAAESAQALLLQAMTNSYPYVRFTALEALAIIPGSRPEIVQVVQKAVLDPDSTVRRCALKLVQNYDPEPEAIAEMVGRLRDFADPSAVMTPGTNQNAEPLPEFPVQWATKMEAHFKQLMANTNPVVRFGALHSLRYYRPARYRLAKQLEPWARSDVEPDESVRREAAEILSMQRPNAFSKSKLSGKPEEK